MSQSDRRRYIRLQHHFPAKLFKLGLDSPVHGVTKNVSAVGALIKTTDYSTFQAKDQATLTLFITSDFSGEDKIATFKCNARVTRIDHQNEGIAVKFDRSLKQII